MAIKVGGTTVIDDSRNVDNIGTIKGLTYPSADGTAGQFLKTDGAGNLAFQTVQTDPTLATLTKSFASGESASLSLSTAISTAPVVSVIKEVPQVGVSSKGTWDVATDGANYDRHNTAYNVTLTPSVTGPQLSIAAYDSKSFSVSSQETDPQGMAFNNDGTKMYVIGRDNDNVHQYSLSTAFDISTASYDSVSFLVSSQDGDPRDIVFNSDGTKMYIVGDLDRIFQYSLSTAFDISTASYDSANKDLGGFDNVPTGFAFNNDGSKLFYLGNEQDQVRQFSLSPAFDISSATYDSKTFSVASQEATPTGLSFNGDGTKMYIVGNTATVYEYTLSTAFDVSTASYSNTSFSVNSEDSNPTAVVFSANGGKMYIVGAGNDALYQYSVGVPALVLGSGSFASTDVGKTIEGNGGKAILTAADGSYSVVTAFTDSSTIASGDWGMFGTVVNATDGLELSSYLEGYDVVTNWSYDNISVDLGAGNPTPSPSFTSNVRYISFKTDGTKLFAWNSGTKYLYEFALSTAWDITTASYTTSFRGDLEDGSPTGHFFKPDGTKLYLLGASGNEVNEYDLSTPWDLTTISHNTFHSISGQSFMLDLLFKPDGTKMFILDASQDNVKEYNLSTPWDLTTLSSAVYTYSDPTGTKTPRSFFFSPDGSLFGVGRGGAIGEFTISTPWDLSTATYTGNSFDAGGTSDRYSLRFKDDGSKVYISASGTGDNVFQYSSGSLFAPTSTYEISVTNAGGQIDSEFWTDINTMTADQDVGDGEVYYAVSTDGRTTWSVIKEGDGVRPIVRDNAGTWEYNSAVGTAGFGFSDASTGYDSVSLNVAGSGQSIWGIDFNSDGTKFYVISDNDNEVNQYNLSTAYDISTATYSTNFSVAGQTDDPTALFFKPDGTKMYLGDRQFEYVREYTLSTAFDISTAQYRDGHPIGSQETDIRGLTFNNNGTKMYISGNQNDNVFQYSLSTAWDVSTATYDSVFFNLSNEVTSGGALRFNPDGTRLFVHTNSTTAAITPEDVVLRYDLTTAYDISTMSYSGSYIDITSQSNIGTAMTFNGDGTKMYISDNGTTTIYQYTTLGAGYTTSTTWTSATNNDELYALQQALGANSSNRMDSAQLSDVTDPNHFTLGNSLDLMIGLYQGTASANVPSSDGVTINYDAEVLNQGAVMGTDYDIDIPDSSTVRVTSNATQNLKIRVV